MSLFTPIQKEELPKVPNTRSVTADGKPADAEVKVGEFVSPAQSEAR